ncbi:hypothetical protein [Streptomyces sp. NRRL S-350]|uniref:hypothetical protein n=1 Tax=Streptomyces sp. NRRL S-350 TaxID=1463902 RepID=UPI0018FE1C3D|nr:hypothetical protein [Streptomyces sp. NRRL S-350]
MTFAEAEAVIDEDGHGDAEDAPDGMAPGYVSPEIDGGTPVIGPWCGPCNGERSDEVVRLCIDLSSRYGAAQAYYFGTQNDGSAWLVAERGVVVRRYGETGEVDDGLLTPGGPLVQEQAGRERMGMPPLRRGENARRDDAEGEWKWRAFDMAPEIASGLGISALALTAAMRGRGVGVLAETFCEGCLCRRSAGRAGRVPDLDPGSAICATAAQCRPFGL